MIRDKDIVPVGLTAALVVLAISLMFIFPV